jgi:hypothetical protein
MLDLDPAAIEASRARLARYGVCVLLHVLLLALRQPTLWSFLIRATLHLPLQLHVEKFTAPDALLFPFHSMKSFFGGNASTREACALRKPVPIQGPGARDGRGSFPAAARQSPAGKPAAAAGTKAGAAAVSKPSQAATGQHKKKRPHRDFSDLDRDDDAEPAAPPKATTVVSNCFKDSCCWDDICAHVLSIFFKCTLEMITGRLIFPTHVIII